MLFYLFLFVLIFLCISARISLSYVLWNAVTKSSGICISPQSTYPKLHYHQQYVSIPVVTHLHQKLVVSAHPTLVTPWSPPTHTPKKVKMYICLFPRCLFLMNLLKGNERITSKWENKTKKKENRRSKGKRGDPALQDSHDVLGWQLCGRPRKIQPRDGWEFGKN